MSRARIVIAAILGSCVGIILIVKIMRSAAVYAAVPNIAASSVLAAKRMVMGCADQAKAWLLAEGPFREMRRALLYFAPEVYWILLAACIVVAVPFGRVRQMGHYAFARAALPMRASIMVLAAAAIVQIGIIEYNKLLLATKRVSLWSIERLARDSGYAAARDAARRLGAGWPYQQNVAIYRDLERWLEGQNLLATSIERRFSSDRSGLKGDLLASRAAESAFFTKKEATTPDDAEEGATLVQRAEARCSGNSAPKSAVGTFREHENALLFHDCLMFNAAVCRFHVEEVSRLLSSWSLRQQWRSQGAGSEVLAVSNAATEDPRWIECEVSAREALQSFRAALARSERERDIFDALAGGIPQPPVKAAVISKSEPPTLVVPTPKLIERPERPVALAPPKVEYICQLGVFRVREYANNLFDRIGRTLPPSVRSEQLRLIERPDRKGPLHVVVIEGLKDEDAASSTCAFFEGKGHDCLVVPK